jgi:hypothetical protein
MGFLDKVKQTAGQVAAEAKKGKEQVKEKIEHGQIRKKADEAAKQLGYLIVKERTEGAPAGEEGDRLVSEIVELEKQLAESEAPSEGEAPPEGEATG